VISCFVAPDAGGDHRRRTGALPVRLGASGIVDVLTPRLDAAEQMKLENAMRL
jgi:hypothetical protein